MFYRRRGFHRAMSKGTGPKPVTKYGSNLARARVAGRGIRPRLAKQSISSNLPQLCIVSTSTISYIFF